jgi:hypothetical protein
MNHKFLYEPRRCLTRGDAVRRASGIANTCFGAPDSSQAFGVTGSIQSMHYICICRAEHLISEGIATGRHR